MGVDTTSDAGMSMTDEGGEGWSYYPGNIMFRIILDDLFPEGDINFDGDINIYDIITLIDYIMNGWFDAQGDINQDGLLNIADCILLVNMILND